MGARQESRLAKLSQPRLHNAVPRKRLFALLDARGQQPVVWVGGPAGSGKTTLVASYLASRRVHTLWYQVDEGDKDPATLFHYLNELARQGRKVCPLPQLHAQDLAAFSRHYFREFFRYVGTDSVVVFDNCQDAAGERFHLMLRVACEELPRTCTVIALSRSLLPPEFARLMANGLVKQVEWNDLRLTAQEAHALGVARGEGDHDKLERAYRTSDGWAAGLMLSLAQQGSDVNEATAQLRSREALFTYMLNEMLSRVSADARKVLTRSALFPQVTVQQAVRIGGNEAAGDVLAELYRDQYLVDRKVDVELTYQFHDLFRDFLLDALSHELPAPELAQLRKHAAEILEQDGQANEAVWLFRQADDWENTARLIKEHARRLLDQGRWLTLIDWFEGMPDAMCANDTWLTCWRGASLTTVDLPQAHRLLKSAYERFISERDDLGLLAVVRPLTTAIVFAGAQVKLLHQWLPALEPAIFRVRVAAQPRLLIHAWSTYVDTLVWAGTCEARRISEVVADLLEATTSTTLSVTERLSAAIDLCIYASAAADEELNRKAASIVRDLAEEKGANPVYQHWGYQYLGNWELRVGNLAQAVSALQRAIAIENQFKFTGVDHGTDTFLSECYYLMGRTEEGDAVLRRVFARLNNTKVYHCGNYYRAVALGQYVRGNIHEAAANQKIAGEAFRSAGALGALAFSWPAEAAYYLQLDRLDEAQAVVETARVETEKMVHRVGDATYCFVLADVALRRDMRSLAITHLREGLQYARNPLQAGMLFSMARCLPRLLGLAVDESLAPEVTRNLIRRWNVTPPAEVQDRWPWPVKIYTLGQFRVLSNDAPLRSKGKAHFKVLALLKAIIAAGAREVSSEALAEWLWPDVDGDTAASNMRASVHRLRKLLDCDGAVLLHDGKVSLNERLCWLDLWSFETSSAEKALSLYRGHFLPQDDFFWIIALRERLHAKFQRAALDVGRQHESAGAYEAAAELYQRCLEADPSAEALHRQLMRCLKAAGRHSEAVEAYRRCCRTLAKSVSKETEQVFESLLRVH
jgi:LuxR family transcriptional regulator, maltose regulon positive regulatory protein